MNPMYESFFKLKEKPFALTPSRRFLYLSEGHKEAFSLLKYGVVERKGFILLTGDVGTGKTTIIQALLNQLSTDVECVHVSNPLLSPTEFIDYLASSTFKRKVHFRSKSDFLFEFEDYLKEAQQQQRAFILIIDEAQTLSLEVLEEIRLLSNLESSEEKLINIFLVGQPELIDRLRDPRCRALYQRIASRFHLDPLNLAETGNYLATRLRVAGARSPGSLFSKQAVQALYDRTQGIPRTLNILADNALLLAYSRGKAKVSRDMIEESYRDMHLGEDDAPEAKPKVESAAVPARKTIQPPVRRPPRLRKRFGWALATAVLLAALIHFSGGSVFELLDTRNRPWAEALPLPPWLGEPPEKRASPPAAVKKPRPRPEPPRPPAQAEPPEPLPEPALEPAEARPPSHTHGSTSDAAEAPSPSSAPVRPEPQVPSRIAAPAEPQPLPPAAVLEEPPENRPPVLPASLPAAPPAAASVGAERVEVQSGDYLAKLALKVYGRADRSIFELLQAHNPDLTDIHRIEVGQIIVFPRLPESARKEIYTVHIASYLPNRGAQDAFRALLEAGYEAFIVPFYSPEKGMLYRVTIGNFQSEHEAKSYASELAGRAEFSYTHVLQLEMSERGP